MIAQLNDGRFGDCTIPPAQAIAETQRPVIPSEIANEFRVMGWSVGPIGGVTAIYKGGEEIGWRGFALPRLQARFGGLGASLILGILWAGWHLINVAIPGLERYGYAFPAFALFVIAQTILFTWLTNHAGGSVLLAWLFHAAINVAGSRFAIGDPVRQWWLSAAAFGIVALAVLRAEGMALGYRATLR